MFRRMMQFKAFPYPTGFCRFKGLIERRNVVRVQVVADQHDLHCIRIIFINKILNLLSPVFLAPLFFDCHPSPSAEGFREHKSATCSVSDIFMVHFFRMVVLREMNRLAGVLVKFYGLFIHANNRFQRVIRSGINFQNILHRRNEGGVLVRRNAPHLPQVRLIFVFFSMRPTCV